jgi:hypothetical protein
MSKQQPKNLWLWIFIVLAILIALLFMFFLKPTQQAITGGSSGGGTSGTTGCPDKPCEQCQARWGVSSPIWECSGTCTAGSCYMSSGEIENPFEKPICYCGEPQQDSCVLIGDIVRGGYCGGTCLDTGDTCMYDTGRETCVCSGGSDEGYTSCSSIVTDGSPGRCSIGYCPMGSICGYDWKYDACYCTQNVN